MSSGRFNWLSRRWIYNIPRNLQTQGLRPLGRLALVDNMERAIEQVTRALCAAADPAGIVATADRHRPAVSAIRAAGRSSFPRPPAAPAAAWCWTSAISSARRFANCNCPTTRSAPFWPIARGRNPQTRRAADRQLLRLAGRTEPLHRPAAASIRATRRRACRRLPPKTRPFNDAYVVHLGEELDAEGLPTAVDTLAKYLYYGSSTTGREPRSSTRCRDGYNRRRRAAPRRPPHASALSACVRWGSRRDDVPPATR